MQLPSLLTPDGEGEIYSALHSIWESNAGRMPDEMRDPDILDWMIFQDEGRTRLYLVDDDPTLILVGDIKPELSATVVLLNHEHTEVGAVLREMRGIIDELALKRLTSMIPGPVKDLQKFLERVGFRREGHMRRSVYWNGRLCGTDIYALYRDPPREQRSSGRRPVSTAAPLEVKSNPNSMEPVSV